jgi:hypothetical protein
LVDDSFDIIFGKDLKLATKKGNTTTGNEVSLKTPSSWKAVLWIKKLGVLITAVQLGQSQTI